MSFTTIANVEGCAEVVLATCRERGLGVALHEPDLNRDVQFRITAVTKGHFRSARAEWGRRLSVTRESAATRSRL